MNMSTIWEEIFILFIIIIITIIQSILWKVGEDRGGKG